MTGSSVFTRMFICPRAGTRWLAAQLRQAEQRFGPIGVAGVAWGRPRQAAGRVALEVTPPRAPTDPDVPVKEASGSSRCGYRCPSHDQVVSRRHAGEARCPRRGSNSLSTTRRPLRSTGSGRAVPPLQGYYEALRLPATHLAVLRCLRLAIPSLRPICSSPSA